VGKAAVMERVGKGRTKVVTRFFGRVVDGPYIFNDALHHPSIVDVEGISDRTLAKIGVYRIKRDPMPEFDPLTETVELLPVEIGSKIAKETWKVVKLDLDEQKEKVRSVRRNAYNESIGPAGDQLDIILKQFNKLRMEGTPMIQEMDDLIGGWLSVKASHPLPE
jgi:hypothetical protein